MYYNYYYTLLCPRPVGGGGAGALSDDRRPSSVCLMSRTSALTRKPKGLGRRNFAQWYPRSHATPAPTSRSKGQKSRSRGGGILWRPPSRTACLLPLQDNMLISQITEKSGGPNTHYVKKKIDMRSFMNKEPNRMSVNCNLKIQFKIVNTLTTKTHKNKIVSLSNLGLLFSDC